VLEPRLRLPYAAHHRLVRHVDPLEVHAAVVVVAGADAPRTTSGWYRSARRRKACLTSPLVAPGASRSVR
jgi:hypothetical protein